MKITSYGINAVNAYKNQVRNVKSSTNKASFADKIEISKTAQEMQGVSTYSSERAERVQQKKISLLVNTKWTLAKLQKIC